MRQEKAYSYGNDVVGNDVRHRRKYKLVQKEMSTNCIIFFTSKAFAECNYDIQHFRLQDSIKFVDFTEVIICSRFVLSYPLESKYSHYYKLEEVLVYAKSEI